MPLSGIDLGSRYRQVKRPPIKRLQAPFDSGKVARISIDSLR